MEAVWMWASADVRRRWPALAVLAVLIAIPVGAVLALVAGAAPTPPSTASPRRRSWPTW